MFPRFNTHNTENPMNAVPTTRWLALAIFLAVSAAPLADIPLAEFSEGQSPPSFPGRGVRKVAWHRILIRPSAPVKSVQLSAAL